MRLFVALELPARVRRAVTRVVESLAAGLPSARWVAEENLHVTLSFLGEVEGDRVDRVSEWVGAHCGAPEPFEARLGAAGSFPARGRARVAWIEIVAPEGRLTALAEAVDRACRTAGVGSSSGRPFHPHVTVARPRGGWNRGARREWEQQVPRGLGGPFTVEEVVLFESLLTPRGARYGALARFPLGTAA